MSHSKKYRSYYSLSQIQYNYFSGAGDSRSSGGAITNYLSQKDYFGRYRYDVGFRTSQNHCKESPVVTSFSKDSSVGVTDCFSFGVADAYGKVIVGPRTAYMTSQNYIIGFMVVILCNHLLEIIHTYYIPTNSSPLLHYL